MKPLCPFCLSDARFKPHKVAGRLAPVYLCPECREQVPALYVQGYRAYPAVVTSAVGFRQHGKTVFFASLFYALKELRLPQHWPTFFTMALNEDSLETVYGNVRMLEEGVMPNSTPKNFPRPTLLRLEDIPVLRQKDWTLLFYDTGGESFEKASQMVQFAGFVRQALTVLFLISITDLEEPAREMHRLLNTYVLGLEELGGRTQDQHLLVVYTKADRLPVRFPTWEQRWPGLHQYLLEGSIDALARPRGYVRRMRQISDWLRAFTERELRAYEFLNAAQHHFGSTAFSIVSALGTEPHHGRMAVRLSPRRILDPLLWAMDNARPGW